MSSSENCSSVLFGAATEENLPSSTSFRGLERALVIVGLLSLVLVVVGIPLGVWLVRREKIRKTRGRKQDEWRRQLDKSLEHLLRMSSKNNFTQGKTKSKRETRTATPRREYIEDTIIGNEEEDAAEGGGGLSESSIRNNKNNKSGASSSLSSLCITEESSLSHQVPLVFVFTDIENSTLLSDTNPTVYREVQEVHDLVMRDRLDEFCGYEINTEGDSFQCAFEKCSHAVLFCERVQEDLLTYEWSDQVCSLPGLGAMTSYVQKRQREADSSSSSKLQQQVWKGPRVRMGIHASSRSRENCYRMERKATGSLEFSGPAFEVTHEVESAASGGQILLTQNALQMARREEEIFHVSMFHLGVFVLRCGYKVSLYQARPSRGPLSYRSFPLLRGRIKQTALGRGLNTLKAPRGKVCFVCLRLEQNKREAKDEQKKKKKKKKKEKDNNKKKHQQQQQHDLNDLSDLEAGASTNPINFWNTLSSSLRYQLESSLRMWMQQFGGYEVCLPDSDVLLVAFSHEETAIRFCMATQIALLLENWSKDVASQSHMKIVYTDKSKNKYLYRGPRLAMALLSCHGDVEYFHSPSSSMAISSKRSFSEEGFGNENFGPDGTKRRLGLEDRSIKIAKSKRVFLGKSPSSNPSSSNKSLSPTDDSPTTTHSSFRGGPNGVVEWASSKVQSPLSPLGEERSVRRIQNSMLVMRLAAPIFMSGEKAKIGQCMAKFGAWYDHYPATACSEYCGADISPSDYLGKKHLVFFFYFTNKTWGCVFEAKYFRDFHHLFASAGAEVIGVSLDGTESQAAFSSGLRLPYPLICDTPGGLHALFGSFNLSMLMRRTYVVSASGTLVSSFETTLGIDGKGYPHVMSALAKVQELYSSTLRLHQTQYRGKEVDLCEKVCKLTKGGHITYIQESGKSANLADLWENLPSRGGPSRPAIVDLGTHQLQENDPLVSLFGISPSVLSGRYSSRCNLCENAPPMYRTLRVGAFHAPSPNQEIALVFTFPVEWKKSSQGAQKKKKKHKGKKMKKKEKKEKGEGSETSDTSTITTTAALIRMDSVHHALIESLQQEEGCDDEIRLLSPQSKSPCKMFRHIAKGELDSYGGYESQEVGSGNFMLAFPDFKRAAAWCAMVQLKLCLAMKTQSKGADDGDEEEEEEEEEEEGGSFGVKMGICCGIPTYGKPHSRTGRQDYFGSVVNLAARIASCANPGQILLSKPNSTTTTTTVTQEVYQCVGKIRDVEIDLEFRDKGQMTFKGFKKKQEIVEVVAMASASSSSPFISRTSKKKKNNNTNNNNNSGRGGGGGGDKGSSKSVV